MICHDRARAVDRTLPVAAGSLSFTLKNLQSEQEDLVCLFVTVTVTGRFPGFEVVCVARIKL